MVKTGFVFHPDCLEHDTGPQNPERPERLESVMNHLREDDFLNQLVNLEVTEAKTEWIAEIHPNSYIESIKDACGEKLTYLESDTVVSAHSYRAALLAAGGAVNACTSVLNGEIDNAFCAIRPPGHHAERTRAMGFCLFNNVAIAASHAQKHHSLERVCIIDWDVHHGNGTQNSFYEDGTVYYISVHQHPLYPGTGRAEERGRGAGEGTTLNFPSPPGCGDEDYLEIFEGEIATEVRNFNPDLILISAGFDAHRDDPLANMQVTESGFARMSSTVRSLADECCNGRLVSLLEGGYNLDALASCVKIHLQELQK